MKNHLFKSAFNKVDLKPFDNSFEYMDKNKQLVFTSTKNRKQKNSGVNFQISKSTRDDSKELYYELLFSAAQDCLDRGVITLEELYQEVDMDFCKCENRACSATYDINTMCRIKTIKSKVALLCPDCANAYKNGQYCYYCHVIYRDNLNEAFNDNKSWIMCDYCESWHHIQCEEAKGTHTNIFKLINDPQFKYMCYPCQNKNKKKRGKDKLMGNKRECDKLIRKTSPDKHSYILSIILLI
jgi:hypothetical protein